MVLNFHGYYIGFLWHICDSDLLTFCVKAIHLFSFVELLAAPHEKQVVFFGPMISFE